MPASARARARNCTACDSVRWGNRIERQHHIEASLQRQHVGAGFEEVRTRRGLGMCERPVAVIDTPAGLPRLAQRPHQEPFAQPTSRNDVASANVAVRNRAASVKTPANDGQV
jgi:hypothetical protein